MKSQKEVILNQEQQACVDAVDGNYVILAGPGSGKTTVLIQRYLKMLSKGVAFSDMLNLSFTHGAAQEMASRAGLLDAKQVFRTFHSFALDLIKKERDKLPFQLCETVIPVELQDYELFFQLARLFPTINWRTLQEKIAAWKCQAVSPDQALEEERNRGIEYFYAKAYQEYESRSRSQGWLDFDNLIVETINLLETNDDSVRNRYKRKYIAVDEAQDCSVRDFKLLQLLYDKNIFAVGDENQLIFEFRNAQSGNLTNFAKVFPGAKVLFLGTNHRSSASLVQFLKEILPIDNGLASHMTTYNETGEPFTITRYSDQDEEAEQVLKKIKDPQHTAIIARTNRQLFVFQRLCAMKGIKYNYLGKKDFWEQSEIKKLLGLAKKTNDSRPANVVLSSLIQEHNLINIYSRVSTRLTESNPVENLNSIVKMAANKGNIDAFLQYLRKLTHARRSSKALTLSTVHMAKGLEFDAVFLVGVDQGVMPHSEAELPEEERVFFVGASRAAKELHMSYFKSPSMFILPYLDRQEDFRYSMESA